MSMAPRDGDGAGTDNLPPAVLEESRTDRLVVHPIGSGLGLREAGRRGLRLARRVEDGDECQDGGGAGFGLGLARVEQRHEEVGDRHDREPGSAPLYVAPSPARDTSKGMAEGRGGGE